MKLLDSTKLLVQTYCNSQARPYVYYFTPHTGKTFMLDRLKIPKSNFKNDMHFSGLIALWVCVHKIVDDIEIA